MPVCEGDTLDERGHAYVRVPQRNRNSSKRIQTQTGVYHEGLACTIMEGEKPLKLEAQGSQWWSSIPSPKGPTTRGGKDKFT